MMATATSTTGSILDSDWIYSTTLYPRHGNAIVTYTPQTDEPYTINYDVRGHFGDFITAEDVDAYIRENYPTSPMLEETNIGSKFIDSKNYSIDPVFLVATAEHESKFGTDIIEFVQRSDGSWYRNNDPTWHNAMGYSIPPNPDHPGYSIAPSWGAMVNRVEWAIACATHYFTQGHYTVDQIRAGDHLPHDPNAYAGEPESDTIAIYMNKFFNFCKNRHNPYVYNLFPPLSFNIYIDPAGYIYDVDTGQRISGASVWLQRPNGNGVWENVSTGENPPVSQPDTNPLISDKDGMYQWDTLPGSYRVHVEAPGYEPSDSIIVSVPPPVFDLHVGLNHIYDPTIPPVLPVANFSTDVSSGYAPLIVQFIDLSENATGISWDLGDGTSSTDRYPIHTYSAPGIYTVRLTASNGNGVNSQTGTIDVQAVPIYPLAYFISNVTEGYTPFSVQFTDLSENAPGIRNWDFGDGANSTDQSPVHTYVAAGNYIVTLTVSNDNGTDSSFARINISEHYVTPPQSVSNLQSSTGSTWINWTWTNPNDHDFNHTGIYLNDIFQTNTSAEYFNATGLQPETDYTIGTRTVDNNGNVNETWVNSTATTGKKVTSDVEKPVIQSVVLFPANTTAGSKINISANVMDNIGVVGVTAGDIQFTKTDGIWNGSIIAPSSVGSYSLSINASDAAGNIAETSVPYRVVLLQGGPNIAVSPRSSSVVRGNNTTLAVKVKNIQNIDDTFKVRFSVSELPASYQANLTWFNWTEQNVNLRAGQEVIIPMKVNVPAETAKGSKLFRANVKAEISKLTGFDTGYLTVK